MAQPLIVVQNLSKSFRRDSLEIPVLRNLSLQGARGEFVAFMGPSGSGKTTFLNLIAGIDKPTEGRIVVAGVDVTELTETQLAAWRSQNVGFIFQFYNLIPVLTAVENVELPLILTPLSKKARRAHAETALEVVGLTSCTTTRDSSPAARNNVSPSPAPSSPIRRFLSRMSLPETLTKFQLKKCST